MVHKVPQLLHRVLPLFLQNLALVVIVYFVLQVLEVDAEVPYRLFVVVGLAEHVAARVGFVEPAEPSVYRALAGFRRLDNLGGVGTAM